MFFELSGTPTLGIVEIARVIPCYCLLSQYFPKYSWYVCLCEDLFVTGILLPCGLYKLICFRKDSSITVIAY